MKTFGMFLGSMIVAAVVAIGAAVIVVGLTCNVAHAQEEAVISTTGQLLQRHDVSSTVIEEDDDLYTTLRGTTDSLSTNNSTPEGIHGPRKAVVSSFVVRQDTATEDQPLGADLYGAATDYLASVANPDSYRLVYVTFTGFDGLYFGFEFPEGDIVDIYVNIITASAFMDGQKAEAIFNSRNTVAEHLDIDISDSHVNGVRRYEYPDQPLPQDPLFSITTRANDFIFNTDYTSEGNIILTSIINTTTGVDLYANAIAELMRAVNPSSYTLGSWSASTAGSASFRFVLPEGDLNIYVDSTGVARMKPRAEAFIFTRDEIARRMRISIEDVHVSGYQSLGIPIGDDIYHVKIVDRITAEAKGLTIIMDAEGIYSIPENPQYTLTLVSVVNQEGINLYALAVDSVQYDYNPDEIILNGWNFKEGLDSGDITSVSTISFTFGLPDGGSIKYGYNVTGEPMSSYFDCRAVREEFAVKSGISLDDVHVNQQPVVWMMTMPELIRQSLYTLTTEKFTIAMRYDRRFSDGSTSIVLKSFVSRDSGIDLFNISMTYVRENYGQNTSIVDWIVNDDFVAFGWMLEGGEIINVNVNSATGDIISSPKIQNDQPKELIQNNTESQTLTDEVNSGSAVSGQQPEPDQADSDGAGTENQDGGAAIEPIPGWMQELLNELLSKNAATSQGGGSKNVHTYDQMAGANNSDGLALRWKR